jgi:hypothetical protein
LISEAVMPGSRVAGVTLGVAPPPAPLVVGTVPAPPLVVPAADVAFPAGAAVPAPDGGAVDTSPPPCAELEIAGAFAPEALRFAVEEHAPAATASAIARRKILRPAGRVTGSALPPGIFAAAGRPPSLGRVS